MIRYIFTISLISLFLHTHANTTESITRTKLEDTPAYSSVISADGCLGGCCRECAMGAINSFRTAQSCDPVDPFTCICLDTALSASLQTSISHGCFMACGQRIVPIATRLLDGYCAVNGGLPEASRESPATVSATQTGETSSTMTTVASTTTSTSTPPTTNSGKNDGLSKEGKIGIVIGSVVGLVTVLGVIFTFLNWWRPRHPRPRRNANVAPVAEGGENIPLNVPVADAPDAAPS